MNWFVSMLVLKKQTFLDSNLFALKTDRYIYFKLNFVKCGIIFVNCMKIVKIVRKASIIFIFFKLSWLDNAKTFGKQMGNGT